MKKGIIFGLTFLLAVSVMAGSGLVVTQKYTGADAPAGSTVTVTWYVSQSQCKMKMEYKDDKLNSTTWFIPDITNGKLIMYSEGDVPQGAQKAYYSVPVQDVKVSGGANVARVSVQKTGETKTIAGFQCEKMIVKTNKGTTEMWVTTDFKPDYFKFYPFFQSSFALMGLSEESIQGFPVEYVAKDNLGNVISSNTFVSGSSSNLSASDFVVPAEYKNAAELAVPAGK